MRTLLLLCVVAPLGAFAQCTRDTECKGDRVCEEGKCVAPTAAEEVPEEAAAPAPPLVEDGDGTGGAAGKPRPQLAPEYTPEWERKGPLPPGAELNPFRVHRWIATWGLLASWTVTWVGAIAVGDVTLPTTVLPVVGPFVSYALIDSSPVLTFIPGAQILLLAAGSIQSAFFVYLVGSIIREVNFTPSIAILPGPAPIGLTVRGSF